MNQNRAYAPKMAGKWGKDHRLRFITDQVIHANPLLIYLIVTIVLLLESCGTPITNNTLLLLTGALASLGHLNIWILTLAAILGSISGACLAYLIGGRGGRKAFFRLASLFHIENQKVYMTEHWFHRSGAWMIFLSRMTPYVRPFTCFLGGISHMPFSRFFIAALTGSIIWCVVMLQIGMALGHRWRQALFLMEKYTIPTVCVIVLLIALYFVIRLWIGHSMSNRLQSDESEADSTSEQHDLMHV